MQPPIPLPTGDVARRCPRCDAEVARVALFCQQCGERLKPDRMRWVGNGCFVVMLVCAIAFGGGLGACAVAFLLDAKPSSGDSALTLLIVLTMLGLSVLCVGASVWVLWEMWRKK